MIDPYLDEIGLHLAQPSPLTEERMQSIALIQDWRPEAHFKRPIEEARLWCAEMLTARFRPPIGCRFVGFEGEAGVCDTVRCEYRANDYQFHIAQSLYVICIQLRMENPIAPAKALEFVSGLSKEVFTGEGDFKFAQIGEFKNGVWGRVVFQDDVTLEMLSPGWQEAMRWWCVGNRVSFITLKTCGGDTREVIRPDAALNVSWFPSK